MTNRDLTPIKGICLSNCTNRNGHLCDRRTFHVYGYRSGSDREGLLFAGLPQDTFDGDHRTLTPRDDSITRSDSTAFPESDLGLDLASSGVHRPVKNPSADNHVSDP